MQSRSRHGLRRLREMAVDAPAATEQPGATDEPARARPGCRRIAAALSASAGEDPAPAGLERSARRSGRVLRRSLRRTRRRFVRASVRRSGTFHPTIRHLTVALNRCQGSHPAVPQRRDQEGLGWQATELPVTRCSAVATFRDRTASPVHDAALAGRNSRLYTFWLKEGTTWRVWLSDEHQAHKAGKCYLTPQGLRYQRSSGAALFFLPSNKGLSSAASEGMLSVL